MKKLIGGVFFILTCAPVFSQETDDMYFNSSDRVKVNQKKISNDIVLTKNEKEKISQNTYINPTDSYSARNVNPDYTAQLNAGTSGLNESFFLPGFQPKDVNQKLAANSSISNNYNNYNSAFCGCNSMYNPYYGSGFGSPFGYNPYAWGNPYYGGYGSGLSMSLGYGFGGFAPGMFGSIGYGFGSSPNYNPWYNNYWGGYGYGYPVVVYADDNNSVPTSRTKRNSRSSNLSNQINYTRPSATVISGTTRTTVSGGRSANPEYYDRSWKRNQNTNPTRSYWSNSNSTPSGTRSDINWGNSSGRQGSSGFSSPSRSSFNNSGMTGGSGSRSSSGSSGSTRGRNN